MSTNTKPLLQFEPVESKGLPAGWMVKAGSLFRAKTPGGWLILHEGPGGHCMCFVPDPEHKWTGQAPS